MDEGHKGHRVAGVDTHQFDNALKQKLGMTWCEDVRMARPTNGGYKELNTIKSY